MQIRWTGGRQPDIAGGSTHRGETDGVEGDGDPSVSHRRDTVFTIAPSRVLRILLLTIVVLVALSTATRMIALYLPDFAIRDLVADFLYVDVEPSLPTLFSVGMMLVNALLCGAIAHARRRTGALDVRHWTVLSAIFGVLALDEFAQLHEKLIEPLRRLLDIEGGPLWFAWVVPAIVALAVFGVFFIRFLRRLPRTTRRWMLTAGVLFVGGALGVEMLSASYAADHPAIDVTHVVIVTVEETLEMLGSAVLIFTLLAYISVDLPGARWTVQVAASDPSQR